MLNTNRHSFIKDKKEHTQERRILRTQEIIKYLRDTRSAFTAEQLERSFGPLPLNELKQHKSVLILNDQFIYRPLTQIHYEEHIDTKEKLVDFLSRHPTGVPAYILTDGYANAKNDVQQLIDAGEVLYMQHRIDGQEDDRVLYPISLIQDELVPNPLPDKIIELWQEVELPPTDAAIESFLAQSGYEVLAKYAAVREKKRALEKKQVSVFNRPGRTKITNKHMLSKFSEKSFQ